MKKYLFAIPLFFCALSFAIHPACAANDISAKIDEQLNKDQILSLQEAIMDTGVTRDAIPAVNNPRFISKEDAALSCEATDVVFVLELENEVRIYPQPILVWHEIINDIIDGKRASITYCPITGSVIGYWGKMGNFTPTFGVSGNLVNNNMIMYDRATNSLWPQLLGVSIKGLLMGTKLKSFPLIWTTYERALERYPDAKVLSRTTGYRRSYGRDPYGSYLRTGTYYQNDLVVYPVVPFDKRLSPKEPIMGMMVDGLPYAVVKKQVAKKKVINFDAGIDAYVAFYDEGLDTTRVFKSTLKNRTLNFTHLQGKLYDDLTKSEWNAQGVAEAGIFYGDKLEPVNAFDSMWFAFAAFYPDPTIVD